MREQIHKIKELSKMLLSGRLRQADLLKTAAELRKISDSLSPNIESVTMSQFIDELNIDLAFEYAAVIQYIQHAAVIKGPGFESFIPQLLEHADDEFKHAKLVANKIDYLGGTPILYSEQAFSSNDNREILVFDLNGEKNAIQRYRKRIIQAEALGEYGIKNMLEGILLDEEDHENDLLTILGIDKQPSFGEQHGG